MADLTFGVASGFPYYNISFFFDYFRTDHGWTQQAITLGAPIGAAFTLICLASGSLWAFSAESNWSATPLLTGSRKMNFTALGFGVSCISLILGISISPGRLA